MPTPVPVPSPPAPRALSDRPCCPACRAPPPPAYTVVFMEPRLSLGEPRMQHFLGAMDSNAYCGPRCRE
eukprot:5376292-Prorocentrum_lima.AAC.1